MVKLLSAIQSLVESSNVLSGLGLRARPDWARWLLYGFSWIGCPSLLMDFQTSISFIEADSWLTDRSLNFFSMEAVLILSLINI